MSGGNLKGLPSGINVALADGIDDIADGYVIDNKLVGIEIDLVLFDEPADRGDFGDTSDGFERVAKVPVLECSELGEVVLSAVIDERIFEDPPKSGSVRHHAWFYAFR